AGTRCRSPTSEPVRNRSQTPRSPLRRGNAASMSTPAQSPRHEVPDQLSPAGGQATRLHHAVERAHRLATVVIDAMLLLTRRAELLATTTQRHRRTATTPSRSAASASP